MEFRTLSNIHDGALLRKYPTALIRSLFLQKRSTKLLLDSRCASDSMCCKCMVWVDCKCMESMAAGWCTGKSLRLDQTKRNRFLWWFRNSTCIDWTGSKKSKTGLKKTGCFYLLYLFEGRGKKEWCALGFVKHL